MTARRSRRKEMEMAIYEATMPDGTTVRINARRHGLKYATAYWFTGWDGKGTLNGEARQFRPEAAGWRLSEPRALEKQAMAYVRQTIKFAANDAERGRGCREQIHLATLTERGI